MGFDEEADTEPQRPRPKPEPDPKPDPKQPDPQLPKDPITREVPKQSAALLIHDPGDGQVRLELVYPEGTAEGDNMPLTARIAAHAMEYITSLSQGDE